MPRTPHKKNDGGVAVEEPEEGRETESKPATKGASRAIWKGNISFGLVNIPVSLHSAEARSEVKMHLLDRKTHAPIRYKRVDESTGKEVEWSEIVHGYEYDPGQYVILNDDDLRRANVEATQTVDIMEFVDASEICPVYYDKPYYLQPDKKARKSYALLREVLRRTGKCGIARLVLRSRQYIAAVYPLDNVIVVDLLRYAYELRDASSLDLPEKGEVSFSEGELRMAERLVETMVAEFDPKKYRDTYHEDVMQMIRQRIESGQTAEPAQPTPRAPRPTTVVNIMDLLKRSVEQADRTAPADQRKSRHGRKAG